MSEASEAKTKMLHSGIVSVAILLVLTVAVAFSYSDIADWARVFYMMAVPIFMTALAFALGYIDTKEDMDSDEIKYMVRRTFIFGGLLFLITLLAIVALYMS